LFGLNGPKCVAAVKAGDKTKIAKIAKVALSNTLAMLGWRRMRLEDWDAGC
jgi:hypothetical protein